MTARMTMAQLAATMPLVFVRPYGPDRKAYARTPAGELAYSDSQGLYEWRDGKRIHYSGGDQQASSGGGFHRHSSLVDEPFLRGLAAIADRTGQN
jgi:hypothetical protein